MSRLGKIQVKRMRKIIDEIVNKRKDSNLKTFEQYWNTPVFAGNTRNTTEALSLKKTDVSDINFVMDMIRSNMQTPDSDDQCILKIRDKEYELDKKSYMIVKSVIFCSFIYSEDVGGGFADALMDWFDGTPNKTVRSTSKLYVAVYNEVMDILLSIIKTTENVVA